LNYENYYKNDVLKPTIYANSITLKKTQPKEYKTLCDKLFYITQPFLIL
jgi:hypothetical protein